MRYEYRSDSAMATERKRREREKKAEAKRKLEKAAPELLAACEKLVEIAPKLFGDDMGDWPVVMDRFEKAIAKATA